MEEYAGLNLLYLSIQYKQEFDQVKSELSIKYCNRPTILNDVEQEIMCGKKDIKCTSSTIKENDEDSDYDSDYSIKPNKRKKKLQIVDNILPDKHSIKDRIKRKRGRPSTLHEGPIECNLCGQNSTNERYIGQSNNKLLCRRCYNFQYRLNLQCKNKKIY